MCRIGVGRHRERNRCCGRQHNRQLQVRKRAVFEEMAAAIELRRYDGCATHDLVLQVFSCISDGEDAG
jgi:hypothetical protein